MTVATRGLVLAFDTANEMVAIGIGCLDAKARSIEPIAAMRELAHRSSNTKLLPDIDALMRERGLTRSRIAAVVCGRGPGSFTGVRICLATAKGIASACEVGLYGVSTPDAIAWHLWESGRRGLSAVIADAMRKEVYPVCYRLTDAGIERLNSDVVVKAKDGVDFVAACLDRAAAGDAALRADAVLVGDGLAKYADDYRPLGSIAPQELWTPCGSGLLLAAQADWQVGETDLENPQAGNPALVLPVYTRLSDAEENERIRLSKNDPRNLATGVQDVAVRRDQRPTAHDTAIENARADARGIVYRPLDAAHAAEVAALEVRVMGSDAWNEHLVLDELPRTDRVWWAAFKDGVLVGYAGGMVVDGDLQILKVACAPDSRRQGIARQLLTLVATDAQALGASSASLEVRVSNEGAHRFYEALGMENIGCRPHYYSDREDAFIFKGQLPFADRTQTSRVAGMDLQTIELAQPVALEQVQRPLILAVESSCDETAVAVADGTGNLLSDVVASQIDFHARFGGVVPEIASRKHIEAICGVAQEGLDQAAKNLGVGKLHWTDLDAVAVTYAPGLVGALVVGLAFAKGAAWGADKPLIGVNHLEGHLYANKIATRDIEPPMVVSLVSGGHTMLVHVKGWGDYETMGSTIDDAVGEAFDKVAKALGLGYPGGPIISKLAAQGNPKAVCFPRAMMHSGDLRFSLSGLKTSVITYINKERAAGRELNLPDIAASFQQAVIDVQVAKARTALEETQAREFCLGGGVAANPALRAAYEKMCRQMGVRLTMPPLSSCTDNAGMIALVAEDRYRKGRFFGLDADVSAHASLDDPY
ncbi:MAG: tRNA (adenosine(37)-N6)-threonylcarbamoyltransferase complex transferase subunit TsaD [Eggerthellaceae bacterium]|jgi:N6-L-threonylcarbamoyladenine synthase/protein kinase Bud32